MKTQSNNKKVRTDFVNSIPEHELTDRQIKILSKDTNHHYNIKTADGVFDTLKRKYNKAENANYHFTSRKTNFPITDSWINLIENIKGNIVLSEYRVRFRFNPVNMKPEYAFHQRVNVNVIYKDKPDMYYYSCDNGWGGIAGKLSERSAAMYGYKLQWITIEHRPDNLRQSVFKGTRYEYLNVPALACVLKVQDIFKFHNTSLLENALHGGWLNIVKNTVKGKSLPEQFKLPRFTKKEIWAIVEFYKNDKTFDLNIYSDYIKLGYKMKKTFGPHRYLVENYQELHDRYIAEKRRLDEKQRKSQEAKRSAIQKWWKKNAKDVKAKDIKVNQIKSPKDLKEFGEFMANCMGAIHKDWKNDYAVQIKEEWVAVNYNKNNKHWEILGYKNLRLPKVVIPKIKRKVMAVANG